MSVQEAPSGPVRHVVLFRFRDDATPDSIRALETAFVGLRDRIPGIVDLEWGTNESPEALADGFTHCFLVTLADTAARDAYLPHPAHLAFTRELQPVLERVLVVDYVPRA